MLSKNYAFLTLFLKKKEEKKKNSFHKEEIRINRTATCLLVFVFKLRKDDVSCALSHWVTVAGFDIPRGSKCFPYELK